ncbi:hypothetical protein BGZ65_005453 [Modicella reniformis]|uniref:Rho-GAP domain-containing protein n=1 Tax=Modicella reniformis TaxID=1440133 RepID=A0A9P6LS91_9FUNG|nr:hypothetical protein BGZ65_005453 [Modicella reniformis]
MTVDDNPRSRLAKGWMKLRQSFRRSTIFASEQETKGTYKSHSAIAEDAESLKVSFFGNRKTVSDMDQPTNMSIKDALGLGATLRSGLIKNGFLTGSSVSSFSGLELQRHPSTDAAGQAVQVLQEPPLPIDGSMLNISISVTEEELPLPTIMTQPSLQQGQRPTDDVDRMDCEDGINDSPCPMGDMNTCKEEDGKTEVSAHEEIQEESRRDEETDHHDNSTFKALLEQVLQTTPMSENGSKIPIALYCLTKELRVQSMQESMGSLIDHLFPEDWDEKETEGANQTASTASSVNNESSGSSGDLGLDLAGSGHGDTHDECSTTQDSKEIESVKCTTSPTPSDLSRLILRFLGDLPSPVMPKDVFNALSALTQLQTLDSINIKIQVSSLLMQSLTPEQRHLLQFLLEYLDDIILKPLRDDIQRLEGLSLAESVSETSASEQHDDIDEARSKYDQRVGRLSRTFGIACLQAFKLMDQSQISQENITTATNDVQAVFQSLLTSRVSIFANSSAVERANVEKSLSKDVESDSELDAELEYQSDSALFDQPSQLLSSRKRVYQRPRSYACRFLKKKSLGTAKSDDENKSDSTVEPPDNVDYFALAVMREHMARSMRSKKRVPQPSVATIHSITAEAGFIRPSSKKTDEEGVHPSSSPLKTPNGTMTPIVEPDTQQGHEENLQLVEKEILRSEQTTKFLISNLTDLYPSSTPMRIPYSILPSARNLLMQVIKSPSAKESHCQRSRGSPAMAKDELSPEELARCSQLTLPPQEPIQLPSNHSGLEDCSCSFCTTVMKPSKIPVMTQVEYELAELQAQCNSKDQYVAELLKAVYDLQGQVNILNAKLLFLHDHHTTRPMKKRTLTRNSYPINPVTTPAHGKYSLASHWQLQGVHANQPEAFPDGILLCDNTDEQLDLSREPQDTGGVTWEENETRSSLDKDNCHNSHPAAIEQGHGLYRHDEAAELEGEDVLDEHYYTDAYKTMDEELHRRPILPVYAPPRPMSTMMYKAHQRMSLPIQTRVRKHMSLGVNTFRWRGRAAAI